MRLRLRVVRPQEVGHIRLPACEARQTPGPCSLPSFSSGGRRQLANQVLPCAFVSKFLDLIKNAIAIRPIDTGITTAAKTGWNGAPTPVLHQNRMDSNDMSRLAAPN